jgi:dGTPase
MINELIVDLVETSQQRLQEAAPQTVDEVRAHHEPLIGFSDEMREKSLELKRFLRNELYRHYRVHRMTRKADRIICDLFEGFMDDPKLLPPEQQRTAIVYEDKMAEVGRALAVSDYIAGMTDRYAIMEHRRIFDPSELT